MAVRGPSSWRSWWTGAIARSPIRADYVGKNMPTRIDEQVDVSLDGVVLGDVVPR